METDRKTPQAVLHERLSEISYGAVKKDPEDLGGILGLAESLKVWSQEARVWYGPWTDALQHQAEQVLQGLKAGRPASQGLERILKAVLAADKNLTREDERSGAPIPGTEVLVFGSDPRGSTTATSVGVEGTQTIHEEDLAGLQDFIQEAPSHFEAIEQSLLQVGGGEAWDVLTIYRSFHTLKGLFGYLGFPELGGLAHQAESLLDTYKRNGGKPTNREAGLLLGILDLFREQTRLIREGLDQGRIVRCPIPSLFEMAATEDERPASLPSQPRGTSEGPEGEEQVIRVETAKMDVLLETLGEWMAFQTQLRTTVEGSSAYARLTEPLDRMGKLARKFQDQVVSLRMVPIQPLFTRVGRVARDLSQKTGKSVRLELTGGDTHLDKRLVDDLWEPILHLVRNAVDHGIEDAGERSRKEKNVHGGLWIKAWHQEGHFILSIRDDGKGLDVPRIEEKARALGWLEDGKELDASEWQDMIFRPGFSTAEKVTDVSGRGIGLDLVRRRLQALKGSVEVATVQGEGCLFILRIPLTLALLDGLLVRVGKGLYLIPLDQIQRFHQLTDGEARGEEPVKGDPRRIQLSDWFGVEAVDPRNTVGILLEADKGPVLLMVDEILGKREIVLKGLNPILSRLRGVNGGAVLGDGRVALVLDIPYLIRAITRASRGDKKVGLQPAGKGAA